MPIPREELIEDIKANFSELVAGFCVLLIALFLLYFHIRQYMTILIGLFACVSIVMVGLEKRASSFDRTVAMLTMLVLALGFMYMS